jgi:hypothetical protein
MQLPTFATEPPILHYSLCLKRRLILFVYEVGVDLSIAVLNQHLIQYIEAFSPTDELCGELLCFSPDGVEFNRHACQQFARALIDAIEDGLG